MENKTLHLFDLDFTLWKMDEKLAVIDKRDPKNVIFRIPADEYIFMKDMYRKYDIETSYNGYTWYLNDKLLSQIKSSKKGIELENIGISTREFTDTEILENQIVKTDYLLENVKHLRDNYKIEVGYITARINRNTLKKNIEVLTEKLENYLKTKINKMYFVNDIDNSDNSDITAFRKAKIVLEFLTGFKIKNNKFTELKQTQYKEVSFYDDETKNIDAVNNLQSLFESLLLRTDESIKKEILETIKNNKLKFNSYQITHNKLNPFIVNEDVLLSPNTIKPYSAFQ